MLSGDVVTICHEEQHRFGNLLGVGKYEVQGGELAIELGPYDVRWLKPMRGPR